MPEQLSFNFEESNKVPPPPAEVPAAVNSDQNSKSTTSPEGSGYNFVEEEAMCRRCGMPIGEDGFCACNRPGTQKLAEIKKVNH
jgi:hypothetical protein